MVGMMVVKRIKDAVGEVTRVGGNDYKIVRHGAGYGLQKIVNHIFLEDVISPQQVLPNYYGGDTIVELKQTEDPTKALTESLKQQVQQTSAPSLEDDLRKQIKDKAEAVVAPKLGRSTITTTSKGIYTTVEGVTAAPGVVPAAQADLRAQVAQKDARQARLDASVASKAAEQAVDRAEYAVEGAVEANRTANRASSEVSDVRYRLAKVEHHVSHAQDTASTARAFAGQVGHKVDSIDSRLSAIEAKQIEEETKMSIQKKLDEQFALQSQFDAALGQNQTKTTGGNKTMKNVFASIKNQFGKVEGVFALSLATGGLAIRKELTSEFVAYNKDSKEITDVTGLTLDFSVPAFKLPTAIDQITAGDIIVHNGEFVYVTNKGDGYLETINPAKGVKGSAIATKNAILGTAFFTVVKTLDAATGNGGGGFDPMLLMALGGDSKKDDLLPLLLMSGGLGGQAKGKQGAIDPMLLMALGDDVEDLLPLVLMQQGGVAGEGFNPLMFLAMNKDGKKDSLLPLLLMQGQAGQGQNGAINPLAMMAFAGDGGSDMKDIFLMQALAGQNGGGIFGTPQVQAPAKEAKEDDNAGN